MTENRNETYSHDPNAKHVVIPPGFDEQFTFCQAFFSTNRFEFDIHRRCTCVCLCVSLYVYHQFSTKKQMALGRKKVVKQRTVE